MIERRDCMGRLLAPGDLVLIVGASWRPFLNGRSTKVVALETGMPDFVEVVNFPDTQDLIPYIQSNALMKIGKSNDERITRVGDTVGSST